MKRPLQLLHSDDGPYLTEIINWFCKYIYERGWLNEDNPGQPPSQDHEGPPLIDTDSGHDMTVLLNDGWKHLDMSALSDGAVLCLYMAAERITLTLMAERNETLLRVYRSFVERIDIARGLSVYDSPDERDDGDPDADEEDGGGGEPGPSH